MGQSNGNDSRPMARVQLAHEGPFRLGKLSVHPATLQVEQDGRTDTLEPRVMQVLVALARVNGKIVTRDELIEQCWDGRVVGDDAINRALSRLRHCAGGFAGGAFTVETIARVGYRLTRKDPAVAEVDDRSTARSAPYVSRRWLLAGGVAVAFGAAALWRLPGKRSTDAQAMKLYLRGIENRGQSSPQQSEQSVSYLREATRLDPDFADAWGALAWGYRALLAYGPRPDVASIEAQCRSAARRALELDPNNVEAQSALVLLKPFYQRWESAERGCRRLLEGHPENSILQYNLAAILSETGRWREAIPLLAAVANRERFWPLASYELSYAMIAAGRIEEAEDLLEQASRRWPRRIDFWMTKHRMLIMAKRAPEAASFAGDLSKRPLTDDRLVAMELAVAEALGGGSRNVLDRAANDVLDHLKEAPHQFVFAVTCMSMLGAVDRAFEMLDGYFLGRGRWAAARSESPATAFLFSNSARALRTNPAFGPLVEEIGLSRYWRATSRQPDFLRYG